MRFLRPDLAPWWEILPVVVACWTIRYGYVQRLRRASRLEPRFAALSRRSGRGREGTVLAMSLLAAGALVFAAVRPQVRLTQRVPEFERQDLIILLDLLKQRKLQPLVAQRFSFAEARKAQEMLVTGGVIGKIVLVADGPDRRTELPSTEAIAQMSEISG